MKIIERLFEGVFWNSPLLVLTAVISSLLTVFAVFYIAMADTCCLLSHRADTLHSSGQHKEQ